MNPSGSKIVLDTSAYSHLQRGHDEVMSTLSKAEFVHLPCIVLGELEAGFRVGSRYRQNKRMLDEFLQEPFIFVSDITKEASVWYGKIFAKLKAKGTPIPTNDIWIAACAIGLQSTLLTFDHDFLHIDDLEVIIPEPPT